MSHHSRPNTGLSGGGSSSTYRRPGTSGTSASRAGGRPVLKADHERVAFSRGLGAQMDATRRANEADAAALAAGNGAAVVVYPSSVGAAQAELCL